MPRRAINQICDVSFLLTFLVYQSGEFAMNIIDEQLNSGVFKINLSGRMDIAGVAQIEAKFEGMTAAPRMAIVVDMSEVPYMSSIGIRALLMNAKAVRRRGGKFALLSPQPDVKMVLETSGIDQLISVCSNLDEAVSKVIS
jgi:anti-anti-sigma factor